MSAIAAVFHGDGHPVEEGLLRAMLECVPHRGGESQGVWAEGATGLGHRLRATTPEAAAEPMPLVRGPYVLSLHGRLDNRAELTTLLGVSPETGDGELLVKAYARWGADCVGRLAGDFAFVLWDGAEQRLFCARDPMGVKPLHYCQVNGTVLVASEIRQVFCYPGAPCRLNETRAAMVLTAHEGHAGATFYEDVYRLPGGHSLTVSNGQVEVRRYWDLDPAQRLTLMGDSAYIDRFRALFEDAVRCRLRSSAPVGVMLSGGLDSSSIACTALTLARRGEVSPVRLFTARFNDLPRMDESAYVEDIVALYGTSVQFVEGNSRWTLQRPPGQSARSDEPWLASYEAVLRAVFEAARAAGVKVLLTGQGGDEVLMATLWYLLDLIRERRLGQLWYELSHLSRANRRYFFAQVARRMTPDFVYDLVQPFRKRSNVVPWLRRSWTRRVDLPGKLEASALERRYRSHYQQLQWGLARTLGDTNWLLWSERVAQEYGIELRHPFLDTRLVDFLCRIPPEQKYHAGTRKLLLRRAMHGILPESIRQRRDKANFHALFDLGMGQQEAPRLERLIETLLLADLGYVDRDRLREAYHRYQQGDRLWRRQLFLTFVLEQWLRESFESRAGESVWLTRPNGNGTRAKGGIDVGEVSLRGTTSGDVRCPRTTDPASSSGPRPSGQSGSGAGRVRAEEPGRGARLIAGASATLRRSR
ncbi:MAG: asparagine synthase (glutamine-hydrolyzing) [Candidatus Rokuibacteriota bacterium]